MVSPSHSPSSEPNPNTHLNTNPNSNPTQDVEQQPDDAPPIQSPKPQTSDQEDPPVPDQDVEDLSGDRQQLGMSLSPIKVDPDIDLVNAPPSLTSPTMAQRRGGHIKRNKKFKGFRNPRKIKIQEKKVQTLLEKFLPIAFEPVKRLDFDKHEAVLKRLGVWDFVHIDFDPNIKPDLIAQLIVNYDPKVRGSYVNDRKVPVNRPDLGRCFKLPVVKREKGGSSVEEVDLDSEEFSDEAIGFIEEFLTSWMVLHGEDDWEMPVEVLNSIRLVKDGHPEKVDWAGLLWCMVEKELLKGDKLVYCHYASHLQYLIKSQCKGMFLEEPQVDLEVEVKEEDEDGEGNQDLGAEANGLAEEPNIELTLGNDNVEKDDTKDEDLMDVEESKEDDPDDWFPNGKSNLEGHILQHCDLVGSSGMDSFEEIKPEEERGDEEDDEEEVEEEEDGFEIAPNDDSLDRDGLTGNLIQGMETTQIPFDLQGQLRDQSQLDPFASNSRAGPYLVSGSQLFFGHGRKRELEPEHDMSHYTLNMSSKRTRIDGLWDHKSSDFGMCMDQIHHFMAKAKTIYESKEQAYEATQSYQQQLLEELQQRHDLIEQLCRSKDIEIGKKDDEILRLENELYLMGNLLDGYRKALKDTQKSFSEYRQHYQLPEEPIYKDAPGGLVLSTTELEKRRQKQEEEDSLKRLILEQEANEILEESRARFSLHLNTLFSLDNRLEEFENTVKLLKEFYGRQRAQKCQDIHQLDDVSLGNPSDSSKLQADDVNSGNPPNPTELQVTDASLQNLSDATELQINNASLEKSGDATELPGNDAILQSPSEAPALQGNDGSSKKVYDATELPGNEASSQNSCDTTEVQEMACD